MQKNAFAIKNCVKTDLKKKQKGYYFPSFIVRKAKIQVLFTFNQFVKLLFCILHFCIFGQTEKNDYLIFLLWNEEKDAVWEK